MSNDLSVLSRIDSPEDLKILSIPELTALAQEMREFIVETVSKTGGHLGPNLGAVELTLALHYVFDFLIDRIVWDVGHQCYPHKILTGRKSSFQTLRQINGISGFPKRSESPYDHFGTGHAGTAVSSALGMALARDAMGEDYASLAVVGDGAATEGMVFEALNHAGNASTDITVVLNDNAWSISPTVGGFTGYLNRLITVPAYQKLRDDLWKLTGLFPDDSKRRIRKVAHRFQESVKNLLVPGTLFEELGFRYIGPVDGHSCSALIRTFKYVKTLKGPVLVHVITQKGKGYKPAEVHNQRLHGVGPFDPSKGQPYKSTSKRLSFTEVFGKTLVNVARDRHEVVAITAAMPFGTGLNYFSEEYPERFFDVGIAEQHAVTLAAGMATGGLRPVVAIYSSFMQRAYDQVIHDVCLQNLPVAFFLDRAGLVGEDGPTHHGVFDISYLRAVPNLTCIAPADEPDLQRAVAFAMEHPGPVAVRYPRGSGPGIDLIDKVEPFKSGVGRWMRQGTDIVVIGIGPVVYEALKAASFLEKEEIHIGVIDARFIKPLDESLLQSAMGKARLVVTVEDNVITGGFGSAIQEFLRERKIHHGRIISIGLPDAFIPHGAVNELREMMNVSAGKIAERIRDEYGKE